MRTLKAAVIGGLVLALNSCGSDKPAPAETTLSGFPSFITTCDHGNRLYWLNGTLQLGVAAQDPTCAK